MGHVFELEESDYAGPIEDGTVCRAKVSNIVIRESNLKDERTGEKTNRVNFAFKLISDDEHDGRDVWGDTSTRFVDHPQCVAADTEIVPIGHVCAGTRGYYQGSMVRVDTRKGDVLHITPNHPVLTARGWVPAGELERGDRVLRHGCPDPQSARADLGHQPARAEEIFEAIAEIEAPISIAAVPSDFHGDGAYIEGAVEAVGSGAGRYQVRTTTDAALVPDLGSDVPDGPVVRRVHLATASGPPAYGGLVDVPGYVVTDLYVDLYAVGSKRVELDEIERVIEQAWVGPVYNFHTTAAAYFAGGIVVHNCKLKSWAESILGMHLPPHYRLDTDSLLDRECRILISKREYEKDGQTRYANNVREVYPSHENAPTLALDKDEPF